MTAISNETFLFIRRDYTKESKKRFIITAVIPQASGSQYGIPNIVTP